MRDRIRDGTKFSCVKTATGEMCDAQYSFLDERLTRSIRTGTGNQKQKKQKKKSPSCYDFSLHYPLGFFAKETSMLSHYLR